MSTRTQAATRISLGSVVVAVVALVLCVAVSPSGMLRVAGKLFTPLAQRSMSTFYSFQAQDARGNAYDFAQLQGKVVLVVNVASKCGFTPQYDGLETLHKKYASKGLVVIGFPCNQFGNQEPGSDEDVQTFCRINHGVTFPVLAKIDVNGDAEHPLYYWLKSCQSSLGFKRIKWNFEKFLINREGQVVDRFVSTKTPEEIALSIEKLL